MNPEHFSPQPTPSQASSSDTASDSTQPGSEGVRPHRLPEAAPGEEVMAEDPGEGEDNGEDPRNLFAPGSQAGVRLDVPPEAAPGDDAMAEGLADGEDKEEDPRNLSTAGVPSFSPQHHQGAVHGTPSGLGTFQQTGGRPAMPPDAAPEGEALAVEQSHDAEEVMDPQSLSAPDPQGDHPRHIMDAPVQLPAGQRPYQTAYCGPTAADSSQPRPTPQLLEERRRVGYLASSCGQKQEGKLLARCEAEYAEVKENYLRGCKWSPDGRMLMTNSNDNVIRIFDLAKNVTCDEWDAETELTSNVRTAEGGTIYDFTWNPAMKTSNPSSCLFATTVRETPIHMFSALTGKLVCSYRSYNQVDEIVAAHSIGFTMDGRHLLAGFNKKLRCFDVNRPGRNCIVASTVSKRGDGWNRVTAGQRGIVSCLAAHPTNPNVMAAGSFSGDVAIYTVPDCSMSLMFEGQIGGITHVCFSHDGNYLFAGGRKDPEIHCFDLRNPERVLYVLYRHVATNQRMYFDIDQTCRYLLSSQHNGHVTTWDLQGQVQDNPLAPWPCLDPVSHFVAHQDTVNGLHINPHHPILATCSGQRHFPQSIFMDSDDDSPIEDDDVEENSLKLWTLKLP